MKRICILVFLVVAIQDSATLTAGPPAGRVIGWGRNAGGDIFGNRIGEDNFSSPNSGDAIGYVALGGHELTNIVAIATEGLHAMALKSDGTVVMWGWDENKKLLTVPPGLNNVTAISLGSDHNVVLKADGTLVAWGYDTTFGGFEPSAVVTAGVSNVAAVAAGGMDTLALKRDGTIEWWGGHYGAPPPGMSNIVAITGRNVDYLVLMKDGTVVEWPSYHVDDPYTMPPGLREDV